MSHRSANPFSTAALFRSLEPVTEKLPKAYLASLSLLAAVGFIVLLSIPVLAIVGSVVVISYVISISTTTPIEDFVSLAIWSAVTLFSVMLSWKLLRMKLPLPQGLMLQTQKYPAMQALLQKLYEHFQVKPIARTTITERFELRVTYTPRFGLPFWSTPTLCIGMPVLQSLSTKHFSCMLAGQIGQHAAPYSRWLHYLKKLQQYFKGYRQYFDKDHSPIALPLRIFFKIYEPAYTAASVFASHGDELEADRYSLEIYNGSDLLETMMTATACQQFLQKRYWPEVVKRLHKDTLQNSLPHTRMSGVVRHALSSNKTNIFLHNAFKTEFDGKNHSIALRKRMENIGYDKTSAPAILIKNAAHELLGNEMKKIITFMDKLWVNRNLSDWKKVQQRKNQKQAALAHLEKQSDNRLLTEDEIWKQARLTEKLRGEKLAIPFYQALLQKNPQHTNGLFAYGRIMLILGDVNGIKLLEQAMASESSLTPQACMLIFKFLLKHNQKERAMQYRNRSLSFQQQHAA